jgi:hypothetical protein
MNNTFENQDNIFSLAIKLRDYLSINKEILQIDSEKIEEIFNQKLDFETFSIVLWTAVGAGFVRVDDKYSVLSNEVFKEDLTLFKI